MKLDILASAYQALIAVATDCEPDGSPSSPSPDDTAWRLCHIVLSDRLLACLAELLDAHAQEPVRLIVHNRDGRLADALTMPWEQLVRLRAERHLPAHARALQARRAP